MRAPSETDAPVTNGGASIRASGHRRRICPAKGSLEALAADRMGALSLRLIPLDPRRFPFTVLHESLPPAAETPAVVHRRTWELLFILGGAGEAEVDGVRTPLAAGDWLVIPPGDVHVFRSGKGPLSALSLFSPAMDGARPDVETLDGRRPEAAGRLLNGTAPGMLTGPRRRGSPLGVCY